MWVCKHCKNNFDRFESPSEKANHSRWCHYNPKRSEYANGSQKAIESMALSKRNGAAKNQYDKARQEGRTIPSPLRGKPGKSTPHTINTKKLLREKALASKHRRLIRSTRDYIKKDGSIVKLDSSWEEALASRLDELNIEWVRPNEPVPYILEDGSTHHYFPDFYLPHYDLFLDPKNPVAMIAQEKKLDVVSKIMKNLIIIGSLSECKTFTI